MKINKFKEFTPDHRMAYAELKRHQDLVRRDLATQDDFDWSIVLSFMGHLSIMTLFCILVRWLNQTGINRHPRFYVLAVMDSISMMLLLINVPSMQVVDLNLTKFVAAEVVGSVFWGICVAAIPSTSILQNIVSSIFGGIEKGISEINVNPKENQESKTAPTSVTQKVQEDEDDDETRGQNNTGGLELSPQGKA